MKQYTSVKVVSKKNTSIFHLHSFTWFTPHACGEKKQTKTKRNLLSTAFLMGTTKKQLICKYTFKFPCPLFICKSVQQHIRWLSGKWIWVQTGCRCLRSHLHLSQDFWEFPILKPTEVGHKNKFKNLGFNDYLIHYL